MRYDKQDRKSRNVEDRRGQRPGFGFPGGRGIRIPIGGKGGFSLTTLLIIGAIMLFFGINPLDLLRGGGGMPDIPQMPRVDQAPRRTADQRSPLDDIPGLPGTKRRSSDSRGAAPTGSPSTEDEMGAFVSRVLADTEDVWKRVFQSFGQRYKEPKLVLFTQATRTGCGFGQAAMGPFYCPRDRKIYVDLAFYDQLKRQFRAPGDFAQAYVIAHEVGHHVQTLLGIADKVQQIKQRSSKRDANALQVRMELQADCLAGVWASLNHQLNNRLEPGDIEEGLNAASQIGDDMIQKRQQGYVVPDAFTHGTAEQRVRWFKRGFRSGKLQACEDAFRVRYNSL